MQLHPGKMPSVVAKLSSNSMVMCRIHWISTAACLDSSRIQMRRGEEKEVGKEKGK